jgi:biopolymer transport protein ExbD
MKFPRNARVFRGHLEAAPFASVFFLLVIFVLLGTLVYTPGVRVQLPAAGEQPGAEGPTVAVAVDTVVATNSPESSPVLLTRFFFANQEVTKAQLLTSLTAAAKDSPEPLTLVVQADKTVPEEELIRLAILARDAGIKQPLLLATQPDAFETPAARPKSP